MSYDLNVLDFSSALDIEKLYVVLQPTSDRWRSQLCEKSIFFVGIFKLYVLGSAYEIDKSMMIGSIGREF